MTGEGRAGKAAGWSRAGAAEAGSAAVASRAAGEGSHRCLEVWSGDDNDWEPRGDVEEWRRPATTLVEAAGSAGELM